MQPEAGGEAANPMKALGPIFLAFGALGLSHATPGRQTDPQAGQQHRQAESEKTALRERLRQQFNLILETRETARGLIMNINDALFDFNKPSLKPGAREKLAKMAGILLAYPGLKIRLEGRADETGTEEYNPGAVRAARRRRPRLPGRSGPSDRQPDRDRQPGSFQPGSFWR